MSLLATPMSMNKKQCFSTLIFFLNELETTYSLERGTYRLNFHSKPDNTVCYSIVAVSKNKIKINNNIFVYFNKRNLISTFDFSVNHFLKVYFEDRLDQFFVLNKSQKINSLVDALNEVYIDQAVIPTKLL